MILMIVPTRGRPKAAAELLEAWKATTTGKSMIVFCVDDDDESLSETRRLIRAGAGPNEGVFVMTGDRKSMCGWTNAVAVMSPFTDASPGFPDVTVFCSLGDDHRVEGPWEEQVLMTVAGAGGTAVVYGTDGIQNDKLATCAFVTSDIVRALGYMVPPGIEHLYADNFWKVLGEKAGVLRFVPELSTPHLHPILGVTPWDDLYRENNSDEAYHRDGSAFDRWLAEDAERDAETVRRLAARDTAD